MGLNASDMFAVALLAAIVTPAIVGIGRAAAQTVRARESRTSRAVPGSGPPSVTRPGGFPTNGGVGVLTWLTAWVFAQVVVSIVIAVSGHDEPVPIPILATALVGSWTVYGIAVWTASRRLGTGNLRNDIGISFRTSDLVGVPVGAAIQLVAIPLIYIPLRALWPITFDDASLQRNATDLVDRADGFSIVVLALIVVIGAPVVEEVVYRGLLQRSITASANSVVGWITTATVFTVIHFRPVEYPGLAVFALTVGAAAVRTRRLGFPIAIHLGFNAAGLALAIW